MSSSVEKFDITIENDKLRECAIAICSRLQPSWSEEEIQVKFFTDGITNRLVGCFLCGQPNDIILIRVYGEKTELFIDRKIEIRNMNLMHAAGLSPPLYCLFNNGICYGYTPGIVLDHTMVRDPKISHLIAEKLAEMHSVETIMQTKSIASQKWSMSKNGCDDDRRPMLFRTLRKYLDLLPRALPDDQQNKR